MSDRALDDEPELLWLVLLRSSLIGAWSAILFAVMCSRESDMRGAAISGLLTGVFFGGTTALEARAAVEEPCLKRDLRGAVLVMAVAFLATAAAIFQAPYTFVVLETGSHTTALENLAYHLGRLSDVRQLLLWATLPSMLAPIFGACAFVRLRGVEAGSVRYIAALFLGVAWVIPGFLMFVAVTGRDGQGLTLFALTGCVIAIPFIYELADLLERRTRELLA